MKLEHLKIEPSSVNPKGGQQVSIPSAGIRITHIPTGLVVISDYERSQTKNKNLALKMMEAGLLEIDYKE